MFWSDKPIEITRFTSPKDAAQKRIFLKIPLYSYSQLRAWRSTSLSMHRWYSHLFSFPQIPFVLQQLNSAFLRSALQHAIRIFKCFPFLLSLALNSASTSTFEKQPWTLPPTIIQNATELGWGKAAKPKATINIHTTSQTASVPNPECWKVTTQSSETLWPLPVLVVASYIECIELPLFGQLSYRHADLDEKASSCDLRNVL